MPLLPPMPPALELLSGIPLPEVPEDEPPSCYSFEPEDPPPLRPPLLGQLLKSSENL